MPQLSCESCAQRKVRCDKEYPCSTCKKMNITCVPVQRMRLPRGRHVHTLKAENRELRDKLEKLNETLESQRPEQAESGSATYAVNLSPDANQVFGGETSSDRMHSVVVPDLNSSPAQSNVSDPSQSFVPKELWHNIHPQVSNLH